jgi:hypothetical protein
MSSEPNLWFRIGYALERTRGSAPSAGKRLGGLSDRARKKATRRKGDAHVAGLPTEELLTAGIVLLAGKMLDAWRPRHRVRFTGLLRASAAGAGAALVLDLVKPLLHGRLELGSVDRGTVDRMLAGLGQGLVYATVLEPRIPGSALLKGVLYGSAEFAAGAAGGLAHVVGVHEPRARLPIIGHLLDDLDPHDRDYVEHLVFGIVVGLLYESSAASNGIDEDD